MPKVYIIWFEWWGWQWPWFGYNHSGDYYTILIGCLEIHIEVQTRDNLADFHEKEIEMADGKDEVMNGGLILNFGNSWDGTGSQLSMPWCYGNLPSHGSLWTVVGTKSSRVIVPAERLRKH